MTMPTLSTRTASRRTNRSLVREAVHPTTTLTRVEAAERTVFARLVRELILASHRDRAGCRDRVVAHLTAAQDPDPALFELLFQCADAGGPDGLDIAIDVLAAVGPAAARYARRLLAADGPRWTPTLRRRVTDGVWYALLRGVAQSAAEPMDKVLLLSTAARNGSVAIREAAVHAIGDSTDRHGPEFRAAATCFVETIMADDEAAGVRQTAAEVLSQLEG